MTFSDQTLGQNVRKAREHAGLTQQQLAQKIGYSQDAVAAWESGRRSAKPEILARLSLALGVPVASFFGEKGEVAAQQLPRDLLVPWDPSTGRIEICLNCLDVSHKKNAKFCETCGEALWGSACEGWIPEENHPCGVIIPPGANHCSACGERSIWPAVRDKIPAASFLQVVRSEFSQEAFITPQPLGREFEASDAYGVAAWLEEQVRVPDPRLSSALRHCGYQWGSKGTFLIFCPEGENQHFATTIQHNISKIQTMLGFLLKRKCAARVQFQAPGDDYACMTLEEWLVDELPF